MANITSIEINQFRGIKQLTVSDFSNINLIVGDNNSGKTTFLEAIQLLFAKAQLSSVKNIIRQRTVLNIHDNSFYTSFIKMFNVEQNEDLLDLDIYAESKHFKFQRCLHVKKRIIENQQLLSPKRSNCLQVVLLVKMVKKQ